MTPADLFTLPAWFDLGATFCFALTGGLAAMRRGYDIIGLVALALVTGVGGNLIREGVFIQQGPPLIATDPRYIQTVVLGACVGALVGDRVQRIGRFIAIIDALGLGTYAVVGVQRSLAAGLSEPAAILVGVINAAGGGLLRDVITNQEPLVFKPGQFYALVALAGAVLFLGLTQQFGVAATPAAFIVIGTTFVLRGLTIAFNWKTTLFYQRTPPAATTPPTPPTPPPGGPEAGSGGGI